MPACKHCGVDHDTETLVRHERDGLVLVHCPDCNCVGDHHEMGSWRDPGRAS